MRELVLGLTSSIIAGIVLFFLQDIYQHEQERGALVLEYRDVPFAVPMSVDDAKFAIDNSKTGFIFNQFIEIKNAGNDPIINGEVRIIPQDIESGREILTLYEITAPSNDNNRAKLQVFDGVGVVNYEVLNPNEEHTIMIVTDGVSEFLMSSNVPNLKILSRFFLDDTNKTSNLTTWFIIILVALVGISVALISSKKTNKQLVNE